MGLFEKKFCDVCGEKIGLLGNRKLDDGNLCKDCSRKLSPFFSERRSSTVAQIKEQLAYREENRRQLAYLNPNLTCGCNMKVHIDRNAGKFIVTRSSDWRNANPDIINISDVTGCSTDIKEHRTEIYTKDAEGKQISYRPPRYEYDYEFRVNISVNNPYFSEIDFELSEGNRPESCNSMQYHNLERDLVDLQNILLGRSSNVQMNQQFQNAQPVNTKWTCPACNGENTGKFCEYCGTPRQ